MEKRDLSEEDIKARYITPAVEQSGWDKKQIRYEYAEALDVKFVYASNGDGFVEQDLITGDIRNLSLDEFPSPDELYHRYVNEMNIFETGEKALLEPYYWVPGYKKPRYYQRKIEV